MESNIPLASSLHEFLSPELGEAYRDLSESFIKATKGVALLSDIPMLKDQLTPKIHIPILQKNKSGYYYLRKLTRSQRKEFLIALRSDVIRIPLSYWMSTEYDDMEDFIGMCFPWAETRKGFEYWEDIAKKARWATNPYKL